MDNREKVRAAIYRLRRKWNKDCYSPYAVNTGFCWKFAGQLKGLFPRGKVFWGDDRSVFNMFPDHIDPSGHCFFFYDGFYYDSESPSGVRYPHLLQYYRRCHRKIGSAYIVNKH